MTSVLRRVAVDVRPLALPRLPAAVHRPGRGVRRLPAHRRRRARPDVRRHRLVALGRPDRAGRPRPAGRARPVRRLRVGRGGPSQPADLVVAGRLGGDRWPAAPVAARRRQPVGAAGAGRRAVRRFAMSAPTRGALVPRLLPVAAGARGQHPDLHDEQPGHRARPADRRRGAGARRLRVGVRDRRDPVHRRPVRGGAAAVRAAARRAHPARPALGGRRAAFHQQPVRCC